MLNNITIAGRLVKDAELRRTNSGKAVASFCVACERDFGTNGEKTTDFISCVAWENTGEFVEKNFHKGDAIIVNGRLQIRKYTDKNGDNRQVAEINAQHVYFGGSKKERAETDAAPVTFTELDDNEELPF